MLETTTLSDEAKTYIAGIQDQQALEFTANYTAVTYAAVNALTTTTAFTIEFGAAGAGGIFAFSGTASAHIVGAGVNEVVGHENCYCSFNRNYQVLKEVRKWLFPLTRYL